MGVTVPARADAQVIDLRGHDRGFSVAQCPHMRITTSVLACMCACGEPAMTESPLDASFPGRCPVRPCAVGPTITSANELIAIIEAAPDWVTFGPYTTGCLLASADILVPGTVTLQADSVAVPTICRDGACRDVVRFRAQGQPRGVECLEPEPWFSFTLCAGIALHDTTIRVRTLREDIHPSEFGNYAPIVDVLPACATPCGADELTCAASHTCWTSVRDHCAYCLGGSNEECGCWDGARFAENGAKCSIATSGDIIELGICRAGICDLGS
jgi:hypothetical protein